MIIKRVRLTTDLFLMIMIIIVLCALWCNNDIMYFHRKCSISRACILQRINRRPYNDYSAVLNRPNITNMTTNKTQHIHTQYGENIWLIVDSSNPFSLHGVDCRIVLVVISRTAGIERDDRAGTRMNRICTRTMQTDSPYTLLDLEVGKIDLTKLFNSNWFVIVQTQHYGFKTVSY